MKSKLQLLITLFLLVFTINSNIMAQDYSGGSGTEADPYKIYTDSDLFNLTSTASDWDKHFIQIADIDLSGSTGNFGVIGNSSTLFTGSYNGQGHEINGLTNEYSGTDYIGLFGKIYEATIKNLHLTNVTIAGQNYVGGLVGFALLGSIIEDCSVTGLVTGSAGTVGGLIGGLNGSSSIKRCYSECSVIGGDQHVGGFVGENRGTIEECYSTGGVTTTYTGLYAKVGGFVGTNNNGSILGCFSTGNVNGNGSNYIGGFVGYNYDGSIELSYSTGDVSNGDNYVGGFAGQNYANTGSAIISRCYSEGNVSGASYVGGFVGKAYKSNTKNCYSLGSVSRESGSSVNIGGFCGEISGAGSLEHSYSTGSVSYDGTTPSDKGFVGEASSFTGSYDANFFNTTTSNQTTATGATGANHDGFNSDETFTTGVSLPDTKWDIYNSPGAPSPNNNYWEMDGSINSGYPFIRATYSTPTKTVTAITENSATCGGNVFDSGSNAITACGVCWSTSQNPTTADGSTTDGTATGAFTSSITGLSASTTYYVRAYVTNNVGTSYGDEETFTTTAATPVELTSFEAKAIGESVALNWQTATEVNNYGFEIERTSTRLGSNTGLSRSAEGWETIGFVEGHGNSNSPKEYSFVDSDKLSGTIQYRLKQIDINGAFEYHDVVTVELNGTIEYKLAQNHPNPFNPSTQIAFTIPSAGIVKLTVYNLLGEVVAELVNQNLEAGFHQYQFNANNLTSGIYFYSISVNGFTQVKKMNLVK